MPTTDETGLCWTLARIREALGVGEKPMLDELPGIVAALVEDTVRLQKQVVELAVAKQRLERACIKAAAPDFLTEVEREALRDFVQFLRSTENSAALGDEHD